MLISLKKKKVEKISKTPTPTPGRGTYYNQGGLITTKEDLLQLVKQGGTYYNQGIQLFHINLIDLIMDLVVMSLETSGTVSPNRWL